MGDELYSCDKIEIGAANVSPPVKPGYSAILQEQSNEFEKQAQRRQFNRKKSKMCFVGKLNKTKNMQTHQNQAIPKKQPKMRKFTQKHAQIAFCSKLKPQKSHKIWKKAIRETETCKKQRRKTSNFKKKTSPKTSNPQVFKKPRNSTTKQA